MRVRRLAALGVVAAALAAAAAPAQAINDPVVPGDDCSPDNSAAVGNAHGMNPGIFGPASSHVSPPVSLNNPGQSTGAKALENSNAFGTCPNSLP